MLAFYAFYFYSFALPLSTLHQLTFPALFHSLTHFFLYIAQVLSFFFYQSFIESIFPLCASFSVLDFFFCSPTRPYLNYLLFLFFHLPFSFSLFYRICFLLSLLQYYLFYISFSSDMPQFSTLSSSIFSFPSISFIHDPHPQFPSFSFPLVLFRFSLFLLPPSLSPSYAHIPTYAYSYLRHTLVHAHQQARTHTRVCSPSPACVTDNEWRRRREDNSVNSSR